MPPVEPFCLKCFSLMRCEKNGVEVHFGKSTDEYTSNVHANLWRCPICGHSILSGWEKSYTVPIPMEQQKKYEEKYKIWVVYVKDKIVKFEE